MHLLIPHISCRFDAFWQNFKSLRWFSPATAQIWHPVTSGFSQNLNHLWKERDFRPWMRFRKIQWEQLMEIGRTVWGPKVPTLKGPGASLSYIQCFFVSCIFFNKWFYFSYYMAGYLLYRPCIMYLWSDILSAYFLLRKLVFYHTLNKVH